MKLIDILKAHRLACLVDKPGDEPAFWMSRVLLLLGIASTGQVDPGDTAFSRVTAQGRFAAGPVHGRKVFIHAPTLLSCYEADTPEVPFGNLPWVWFMKMVEDRGVASFVPTGEERAFLRRESKTYRRLARLSEVLSCPRGVKLTNEIAHSIEQAFCAT